MFDSHRIMLAGATGLVGSEIMRVAAELPELRLIALTRRQSPMPRGAVMEMMVADPADWHEAIRAIAPHSVICALGTTRAKAGSAEAFRAVDHDLVLTVAQAARDAGAEGFVLISSVGANPHSQVEYLRVKGEVESALGKLRFKRSHILRPGLLKGTRIDDPRPLEGLAKLVSPVTDLLLRGGQRGLRSIDAHVLAEAALYFASSKMQGRFVHEHDAILRAARKLEREHDAGEAD
ncbi:MAG: hypothetical protein B7Z08_03490 [Sphingomonadales bacterium 32-68-7]|nr:MAG: hypothetical protein B7Z33_05320 [Sphingomonadales bacterium 12-68-11]OYX09904.1 MAG: hypothetical protein B7Z08_03490 [Sphingomonadales bacterium 32-68-7]